jgi:hypothetical protein
MAIAHPDPVADPVLGGVRADAVRSVLIVANETLASPTLADAVADRLGRAPTRFYLVVQLGLAVLLATVRHPAAARSTNIVAERHRPAESRSVGPPLPR